MARKLLMIDDDAGVTKVVAMIAAGLEIEFKALNRSANAIGVFRDFQPDIVILDMIMPGKDGIEVLNEIMLSGLPTRIVLTSGLSDGYLRLAEGVAKFHGDDRTSILRKPFRRQTLVELLNRIGDETPASGTFRGPPAQHAENVGSDNVYI